MNMRWIINYIRSCFCKHEWELLHENRVWDGSNLHSTRPIGTNWVYRCKECGWHNIIKNY